ncbi:MAG: nucleoside deaminase [Bacteroidota bacterium]|nr:nucleoside deaminase [Bacteroidota bacterium]
MDEFSVEFMREAIRYSKQNLDDGSGGPFGAVIVKDQKIIAGASNKVTSANDPTAHAEMEAIRLACKNLNNFSLEGCIIYTSCEPCPMCLSAIHWARIDKIYHANTREDAAEIDFDDHHIYKEVTKPAHERIIPMIQMMHEEAKKVFDEWKNKTDKIHY